MRIKYKKAKPKEEKRMISNRQIRAAEVFLIDENGEQVGNVDINTALTMAQEADLDLVLVNPKPEIPIAKIVDLGQLKYEADKKAHKEKVAQKKTETKTIRLSVRISAHDFEFRLDQAEKFLTKYGKLKIELMLKGREKQHPEKGRETISGFIDKLKTKESLDIDIEQPLTKQGGRFTITLVNKK